MRYIVKHRTGGGWQVLDQKTNILRGPFGDKRIAEELAARLNKVSEREAKK